MAETDEELPLLAWPQSLLLGRSCGSRYASGVAQALIRLEVRGLDVDDENEINAVPNI